MTYSIAKLVSVCSVLTLATAIHLEFSTDFLRNALHQESTFLNGLLTTEWAALGNQGTAPKLRYNTLIHRQAFENAIEFVVPGETSEGTSFEAVIRFSSVAGDYKDLFDNRVLATAEVNGIADGKAIKEALNAVAAGMADWAHNKMHEATDVMYVTQTVCLLVTRLGG